MGASDRGPHWHLFCDKRGIAGNFSDEKLRQMIITTRQSGFASVDGLIVQGLCTVAVPVLRNDGTPLAGISLSAIRDRMDPSRQLTVALAIAEEIAAIGTACGYLGAPATLAGWPWPGGRESATGQSWASRPDGTGAD